MRILVINSGSSSLKYKLFDIVSEQVLVNGIIERIGLENSPVRNYEQAIEKLFTEIDSIEKIKLIGHRVVHGGEKFTKPIIVTEQIIEEISNYNELAPLHNPANLMGIRACLKITKNIPQVAVFDTAFHQTLPKQAYIYALPYEFYEKYSIRKYGFHGLSHQYVCEQAAKELNTDIRDLKIISCHLGNGCSITAVDKGRSIDTSLGFTPLSGLVMGTRSGDIDPSIIFYLSEKLNLSIEKIKEILNKKSGLLGISGISSDMRDIKKQLSIGSERAKLAIEIFSYSIIKYIGAYIAAMNGLDVIVFTAGLGENNPDIKEKICAGISSIIEKFDIKVLTIPTNEELMIAREALKTAYSKQYGAN